MFVVPLRNTDDTSYFGLAVKSLWRRPEAERARWHRDGDVDECDGGGAEVTKTNSLSREAEEDQSVGGS